MFAADALRRALSILGALLADRGHRHEVVVIGGGALLLASWIERPTKDLDALAIVVQGHYQSGHPLPPTLREAIEDTAGLVDLDPHWLNAGPTDQLKHGLPPGFQSRTSVHVFGGLTLHVAGRFDQICLKLYAAADQDPRSKHVVDLVRLAPTVDELAAAAPWVKGQDAGAEFAQFVDAVIQHLEAARGPR
jgi:hypothetical protein